MEKHKIRHVENNELYNKYASVIDSIQNALMREFPLLIQEYRLNMNQTADLEDFINDRATMFRFLRKNNYSLPTTLSLLLDNIKWRLQQDVDNMLIPTVEHFLQDPLVYFHEFDKLDRPILVINLAYLPQAPEGCDTTEFLTPLVIFVLETARQLTWSLTKERELDEDVVDPLILEIAVLVNFKNASSLPMDISLLKSFITLLRRYPGMTGSVYFLNFGWMYQGLWQMCKLVLSDEAKSRVSFPSQKELLSVIASEDLLADFGGNNNFSWSLEMDDAFLKHRFHKSSQSRRSSVSSLHSTYYDTIDIMNSPYLTPANNNNENNSVSNSPRHSPLSIYGTPISLTPLSLTPASSHTNLANVARAYSNLSLNSKLGPGISPRLRSTFKTISDLLLTSTISDEVSSRTLTEKLNELKQHESGLTEPNYYNENMNSDMENTKNQLSSFSSSSLSSNNAPSYSKPSSVPPRAPQTWFVRFLWKFQDMINQFTIRIAKKILKYRGALSWVLACILLRNGVQEVCQHILLLMMEIVVKGNTAGSAIGLQSFLSLTAGQMTL